ncbi:trehalose-phosphatase family protein, putative [Ichthyophthirius multifiliis]|uniref:Trehalose-phosphatase family protein, putative n=1 Tax=Ichthyophthirius multifiliis TaxID=5932 RepID=G0QPD3_ICHMU|nr:trehalose-phosphatase family protein, putative [Ichthyophthirius multifiliis]EGR32921.1 trehalose-phosphatase family protein, putative [Ichthyophthirius multifiliis]|eukprot:XP_004036907.1 trehalose-phosphatase family protein, putative [Ichthyophthirius multifiliis]
MTSYLKFSVQFHTQINQSIRIIGNIKDLGEWDTNKGLCLQTNQQIYPEWTHETFIEVPFGILIEFKCALYEREQLIRWERFEQFFFRKLVF